MLTAVSTLSSGQLSIAFLPLKFIRRPVLICHLPALFAADVLGSRQAAGFCPSADPKLNRKDTGDAISSIFFI